MSQGFLLQDILEPSWETWPKAGMTVDGAFYPQPKWELRISEIASGLLPTPAAQEPGWTIDGTVEVVDKDGNPPTHYNQRWYDKNTGRVVQKGLTQVVQMWPTPTADDANNVTRNSGQYQSLSRSVYQSNGGALNPRFVEWLMDMPEGWLNLKPLETHKWQAWLQQHGIS